MTEEEARHAYAAAWAAWRAAPAQSEARWAQQEVMDAVQPFIAESPRDPRWPAFTATLPGYNAYWAGELMGVLGALGRAPALSRRS